MSDNLLPRDLTLSFGSARAQKVHFLQHENFQSLKSLSVVMSGSRPAVPPVNCLQSNCHLKDCWPLAGREE